MNWNLNPEEDRYGYIGVFLRVFVPRLMKTSPPTEPVKQTTEVEAQSVNNTYVPLAHRK